MREKFLILSKNIRRRKIFSIIIFTLSMFATLFLITAIGTVTNVKNLYDESYDKSKTGDIFVGFMANNYSDEYADYFLENEKVKSIDKDENFIGTVDISKNESVNSIITIYDKEKHDYSINVDDELNFKLKDNETLIPSYFRDEYDLKKGDIIYYDGNNSKIDFKVAGFFEDPIFGSPFYETKRMLISEDYYNELKEKQNKNKLQSFYILNVELKEEFRNENFSKNTNDIIEGFDKGTLSIFSLDRTFMTNVRLMVPRIISILLIVFSIFFIAILTIVLRYTILATIETDFSSLGILKAVGFRAKDLIQIFMIQFSITSLLGAISGTVIAYSVISIVGKILLSSSGIWWSGSINWIISFIVIILLLIYIILNTYLISKKIKYIKPIEAIMLGKHNENKVKKGINIEGNIFRRMPLLIRLSGKNLSTNFSQYSTLIVICIILSFMLSTIFGLNYAFNDEEKVSNLLGFPIYDIKVEINDSNLVDKKRIDNLIDGVKDEYKPKFITGEDISKIEVDNTTVLLSVNTVFDSGNVVEGKIPQNYDEIMITDGIRRLINKDIGDKVELALRKNSEEVREYKIVGINNNVIELGKNISMLSTGYEKLKKDYYPQNYYMKLDNVDNLDSTIESMKFKYEDMLNGVNISNSRTEVVNTISMIQGALSGAAFAVVTISTILIILIIALISIVVIAREIMNIGILRSLGFTSVQVRIEIVTRFILVSLIGSVIGSFLNNLIGERLINTLFKIASISKVPTGVTSEVYIGGVLFVLGISVICAWIVSGRVKKIKTKILLTE